MSSFRTVSSTLRYLGFSSVRVDIVQGPDGSFEREVVAHPDAVAIVALDERGRVALVRQYRQPIGTTLLELPAGTLDDPDEDPVAAAHRELAEETGLAAETLVPLGTILNSAGWSDERTSLFLATRVTPVLRPEGFQAIDEEASMTVSWEPLALLVGAALDGKLDDAKTVIGVLRADARLREASADASR